SSTRDCVLLQRNRDRRARLIPLSTTLVNAMSMHEEKINLMGLSLPQMQAFFVEIGEKPFRASQVLKWIHQRGVIDIDTMTDISKPLREKMTAVAQIRLPEITQELRSADGSCKWIVKVASGSSVEMVYIPEAGRGTLCVSSQAGCI